MPGAEFTLLEDHWYVRPVPVAPAVSVSSDVPLPHIIEGLGTAVPAVGVPEHSEAVIVCTFDDATGLVPVSDAAQISKPEKLVLAREIVLPPVAVASTSAVIWIYPVLPALIVCGVKEGSTLLPAVPGDVNVESSVAVPVLKVGEDEYQHFIAFTSEPIYEPAVTTVRPESVASAEVTARLKVCSR